MAYWANRLICRFELAIFEFDINGRTMRSFFKIFFASLLALVVFSIIVFFLTLGFVSGIVAKDKAQTGSKAVLWWI